MNGCALGIDVGGTKIAVGVVSFPDAKVIACEVRPTWPQGAAEVVLEDVAKIAEMLAAKSKVKAVGIAICELVDVKGNIASNNCLHWTTAQVLNRFATIAPTIVEADVRAAALGEALYGAGKPYGSFLHIAVGTGISSCLVIGGKPYVGARGLTGTFASSALPGLTKSLEDLASGAALAGGVTVDSAAETLGAGIGLLINTLDPEAVVVGGGLGLSGGAYWDRLVASTRRHVWSPLHRDLPILPAASPHSALIGAAATALIRSSSGS